MTLFDMFCKLDKNDPFNLVYEPKKEINLWILTDSYGRIYYQGFSEESVNDYKESNGFKDRFVIKLTGYLPGEKVNE